MLKHFQTGNDVRMGFQTLLSPEKAARTLHFSFPPRQTGHELVPMSVDSSYAEAHLYFIKV